MSATALDRVLAEVKAERERQDAKWGVQTHDPVMWFAILSEEVGEVAKDVVDGRIDADHYRLELIQTAAVAVSAVQALDRMGPRTALDRLGAATLPPAPARGAHAHRTRPVDGA